MVGVTCTLNAQPYKSILAQDNVHDKICVSGTAYDQPHGKHNLHQHLSWSDFQHQGELYALKLASAVHLRPLAEDVIEGSID